MSVDVETKRRGKMIIIKDVKRKQEADGKRSTDVMKIRGLVDDGEKKRIRIDREYVGEILKDIGERLSIYMAKPRCEIKENPGILGPGPKVAQKALGLPLFWRDFRRIK